MKTEIVFSAFSASLRETPPPPDPRTAQRSCGAPGDWTLMRGLTAATTSCPEIAYGYPCYDRDLPDEINIDARFGRVSGSRAVPRWTTSSSRSFRGNINVSAQNGHLPDSGFDRDAGNRGSGARRVRLRRCECLGGRPSFRQLPQELVRLLASFRGCVRVEFQFSLTSPASSSPTSRPRRVSMLVLMSSGSRSFPRSSFTSMPRRRPRTREPATCTPWPQGAILRIRLLLLSETYRIPPGPIVTPCGWASSAWSAGPSRPPVPLWPMPTIVRMVPSAGR